MEKRGWIPVGELILFVMHCEKCVTICGITNLETGNNTGKKLPLPPQDILQKIQGHF
jgi:hypothetical protein